MTSAAGSRGDSFLPAGFSLVALATVDSTNEEAKRLALRNNAPAPDGTVVWAESQTAGRGRHGRGWISPPGNLYCSILLRPPRPLGEAAGLGFAAALAIVEALAGWGCRNAHPKWPNDVLVNGHKIAGVLLESQTGGGGVPDWLVVGMGVNLSLCPRDVHPAATSLAAERGAVPLPRVALGAVLGAFARWRDRWLDGGLAAVLEPYRRHVWGLGQPATVRLGGETIEGTFEALDDAGALVLRLMNGQLRHITAGDVYFSPNGSNIG
ncbi:MAG: biotin--[acetyl-CoA-carboxylase] ligase [Alphaproteobacteria bacterium]|nr:biotin--[acetyl-CoA-carboxylase] ligase [Alphaproteobacteria bacterium]